MKKIEKSNSQITKKQKLNYLRNKLKSKKLISTLSVGALFPLPLLAISANGSINDWEAAYAVINAIIIPAQKDKLHAEPLFRKITGAVWAARIEIDRTDRQKLDIVTKKHIKLINKAIQNYKNSTGTDKILADNIVAAIAAINAIDLPAMDNKKHNATLFPAIEQAKKAAIKAIEAVTDYKKVAGVKSTQIDLIKDVIDAYIKSTGTDKILTDNKQAAIAEINAIDLPAMDNKKHNATLFPAIEQAKKAAIKAIEVVTDYKKVAGVKSTQIDLIKKAIEAYNKSIGTNKILADNIAADIAAINAIDLPIQNNDAHNATLFPAIEQAKKAAIKAIEAVTDYKKVAGVKSTQIDLIKKVIDAYKKSTGTDKEKIDKVGFYDFDLPKDKDKLPSEITNLPKGGTTKSGVEYKFSNWRATDLLGKLVVDVSMKIGVATRKTYVTMYNFKVKSLAGVTQVIGINDDNKDDRKKEADSTNMYRYYKMGSKGTHLSKTIYENITPKSWTQKFKINFREVTPSIASKNRIYDKKLLKEIMDKNQFSTNDNLVATLDSSTKNNQVIKRYELKDATNKAYIIELIWVKKDNKWDIQTKFIAVDGDTVGDNDAILAITIDPMSEAELLNELKNAVPSELEGLKYPTRDDKARSATLFHEIKTVKDNALKLINAVKEIGQFAKIKSTQIDLIKKAIDEYKKSTGTDKMLADNIDAAIAAISAIDLPNKDDKLYDSTLFAAIDQAKTAAINAIEAVTDYKKVAGVKSTQIDLIKKAIDEYNNSSGTNKILADNIASAFAAINAINLPNKDDKLHDANLFPAIDQAKIAAIKAIEAVTEHLEVEGMKLAQIKLINDAIDAYKKSNGTDKILADNKAAALAEINAINLPAMDNKKHDATLFPVIDQAKTAAINAIEAVTERLEVEGIKLAQIKLINDAIDAYNKSTGTDKILADNKQVALAEINAINLPIHNNGAHDATLFPAIDQAKTVAIKAIEALSDYKKVEGIKLAQIKLINDAIDAYKKSTGTDKILADNKTTALTEINAIQSPTKNDKLHSADAFSKIDQAKKAAINAIQAITDYKEVDGVKLTQIDLINDAIDAYNKSTGTDKILADNKQVALAEINAIDLPIQNNGAHDATLFPAIDQAKTAAIKAIEAVTEYLEVEGIKLAQIKLINDAIDAYNKSTGTDKILADNKDLAISELKSLEYPNKDDKLHFADAFSKIDQAKTAAIKAIEAVTEYLEVEGIKLAQIKLINDAIDAYKKSNGTDKILADNKAAALAEINAINLPAMDNKKHDATLFPVIDQAKTAAINAIEVVTERLEVEGIKLAQIKLINDAIDAYKKSTGTDKILADNKTTALAEINAINLPAMDNKKHNAILFLAIDQAKTDAIKAIEAVSDYKKVEGIKLAQIKLINDAIDAYNKSTGTDKILADNKQVALAEINAINLPIQNNSAHDATLFPAIDQAKTAAIKAIEAVTEYLEVEGIKLAQIKLINDAIYAYKKSNGTDKILADNKAAALAAINAIDLPSMDNKKHDATLFPVIDQAKTAAINAIEVVTERLEVEGIKLAQIKLINDAIDAYNKSTGTDKILADNKQVALAEINAIDLPIQNNGVHDATLFPAIDQAKAAAINAIEAVSDYKKVEGIKLAQINLIKAAIDEYKKSTGTDKILADNIVAVIAAINAIDLPNKDDKLHDTTLFPAIDQAKKTAIKAIEAVTDYKKVEGIKTTQIDLITKAIVAYKKSTGTDKILADNNQNFFQKHKTLFIILISISSAITLGVASIIIRKIKFKN